MLAVDRDPERDPLDRDLERDRGLVRDLGCQAERNRRREALWANTAYLAAVVAVAAVDLVLHVPPETHPTDRFSAPPRLRGLGTAPPRPRVRGNRRQATVGAIPGCRPMLCLFHSAAGPRCFLRTATVVLAVDLGPFRGPWSPGWARDRVPERDVS